MFQRDNFILIPGFAITDLKLSGSELIAYSLIYGFSQDGESEFKGSLSYVASALNITRQNAKAVLDRLAEKGLIVKRDETINGVKFCRYSLGGVIETVTPLLKQQRGVIETAHNNTNDNIGTLFSLHSNSVKGTAEKLCLFADSKFSNYETFAEHFKGEEFSGIDVGFYFHQVMDWSAAGGKKKKDWIATARNWIRSDIQSGKVKRLTNPTSLVEQYMEDRKRWLI